MARRQKGRSAVLIVQVPENWKPASPNAVPPQAVTGKFYSRRQPLGAALAITEAYNRSRLPCNGYNGTWALCVVSSGSQLSVRRLASVNAGAAKPAAAPALSIREKAMAYLKQRRNASLEKFAKRYDASIAKGGAA